MCKFCKKVVKLVLTVTGVLFVVYFWNLDQKALGVVYNIVNKIVDRKKVDVKL